MVAVYTFFLTLSIFDHDKRTAKPFVGTVIEWQVSSTVETNRATRELMLNVQGEQHLQIE